MTNERRPRTRAIKRLKGASPDDICDVTGWCLPSHSLRQISYSTWCYKSMRCVATCNVLQHRCIAIVSQHVLSHPERKLALKVKYFCHNRKFNSRLQANSPRNQCECLYIALYWSQHLLTFFSEVKGQIKNPLRGVVATP